jgi:predicted nucleic acid-binding protein
VGWVVDTCLLIDVLEDDPAFGQASAELLDAHLDEGLLVCPVTYAELAPAFGGNADLQNEFLAGVGVDWRGDWIFRDTLRAHAAWADLIEKRRSGILPKRPIADILIGAFAVRHDGILTRNPSDFASLFPDLTLRVPEPPARSEQLDESSEPEASKKT